ncbi:hypothetical protein BS78_04G294400 [Paspalum vaginatum]|nr:hypothetical protein BS78_04G294400 [Paspalum vaginatum]
MRTSCLLLFAIALMVVSSDMTVKVSALCQKPRSVILYPARPCNPKTCKTTCAGRYMHGVGTCMNPNGCDCEYCLDLQTPKNRTK